MHGGDRIEVLPFSWQRRYFSAPPETIDGPPVATTQSQLSLGLDGSFDWQPYVVPVIATYDTGLVDERLGYIMRGVWRHHVGDRGQIWHAGPPHTFVRAGEETALRPGPALANLPAHDAAALWQAGMRAR